AEKATKKQKLDEEVAELKKHLQIVPNDEDDVYTKATPLARKESKDPQTESDEDENLNLNPNDDEEKEKKDDDVRTPDSFEFNDDDDEEYDELYKDVSVRSKVSKHKEVGKEDAEMTDATHESASQEKSYEQVIEDAYVTLTSTQKTEDKLEKSKSYRAAEQHRDLYDALVKSYQVDKDLFDSYGKSYSLKRGREDKDKDEDPPAGSDQGLKKRKTSKDLEQSRGSKLKESKSISSKYFNSQSKSSGKSTQAEELVFETAEIEMPQDQRDDMEKTRKPPTTFDELMSTPVDFSAYVLHNLKIENLSLPLIEDQGHQVVPANYFFNNDLEYLKGGSSSGKYTTSITKTKA
nr:hypothetical protein [Tanacetum cinerariifolium]